MQFYATVSLISGLAVVLVIVVTLVLGRRPAREKVQSPPTNDSVEVSGNLGANEDEGTSGEGLHPALVAGSPGMKKCPYCGGEILAEAVKCKHCREFLTQSETTDAATSNCSVSDASSVRRPHNSLLSARLFILPLVGVAAVFAGWESIKVVNAYHALHEAGQEEMKAGARLLKATDQEAYSIREMGLDEYARKVNAGASSQDSTGKSADLKAQFQQGLMDWLNDKDKIKELSIRCVSVTLKSESADSYKGLAAFDNGEQVRVEVGRKKESGEMYFRADPPLVVTVRQSTLPSYDHTTIGNAFDTFFRTPKWEYKLSENGTKFVEFTGELKDDLCLLEKEDAMSRLLQGEAWGEKPWWLWVQGDKVRVRFAFSCDGETFNLWSIQKGDTQPVRMTDLEKGAMLGRLLEAIYDVR